MFPLNYAAIVVAALANFLIGFMFHGPLFGKTWMRLANIKPTGNEKFKDMIPQMIKNLLANVLLPTFSPQCIYLPPLHHSWGEAAR